MAARFSGAATLDASAITLSGLCLIHCLALPLIAAFLPLAGVMAEAEWVHKAFVVAAIPVSVLAMLRSGPKSDRMAFIGLATLGLGLLIAAAFVEALHDHETALTVAGAVCLGAAHIYRWASHSTA